MLRKHLILLLVWGVAGCGGDPASPAPGAPTGGTGTSVGASSTPKAGSGATAAAAAGSVATGASAGQAAAPSAGKPSTPAAGGGGMVAAAGTTGTTTAGTTATSAAGSGGASSATAGSSGDSGTGSGGAGASTAPAGEPKIPMPPEPCPMLKTGNVMIQGTSVQLWVGTKQPEKKAPILIYWHVTGGNSTEATTWQTAITEITGQGGIVASGSTSTGKGSDTGNGVWYTDDFKIADEVVACAVAQLNIDTHRIYTAGGSAGALQAGIMTYKRSSYLAASVPNSGGYTIGGNMLEDPTHVPAVMTLHGAMGADMVIVDFSVQSLVLDVDVVKKGGFAVDCNHMGGHVGASTALIDNGWQFMKDHPFGVSPEPYANGLPMGFPAYCKIIKATDTAPAGCCASLQGNGGSGAGGSGGSGM
jgi:hypothetical protein